MTVCPFSADVINVKSSNKAELLAKDSNLWAVMNTVLDGIIIIDSQGLIQAFNPAAVKMFGYQSEEVLGKNIKMLMPEPYCSEHDEYLKNYLTTKNPKVIGIGREVSGKRKTGEIFPMELGVNAMKLDQSHMFVGMIRDISERKRIELDKLNFMEALKRSNQELDNFAYIASHDLKEPLRGLSNNALFLKEDYQDILNKDGIKRIDRMIFLCNRMEQLVNDLLYFSRLGKQELAIKPTNLNNVISDISVMIETDNIQDLNIDIRIPKKLPNITCDSIRITEVFRNLITNAIKYNNNTKKIIEIGFSTSNPDYTNNNNNQSNYVFYVKDNGIGIQEKYYNDIFRIFKRLNDENEEAKGTGVGLTFVRKIIERHGGSIWVESQMGIGSTFYFTIKENHIK